MLRKMLVPFLAVGLMTVVAAQPQQQPPREQAAPQPSASFTAVMRAKTN